MSDDVDYSKYCPGLRVIKLYIHFWGEKWVKHLGDLLGNIS